MLGLSLHAVRWLLVAAYCAGAIMPISASINFTYPTQDAGWFLGEVNSIAWLNASFYEGAEDRYDDLPDPIVFNVTLLAPIECQGVCTDYQATYGPLHGSANATQLSVSQHAPPGNYSFQASFYVAAKDTDVVLGASQPFSLQVPPASAPLKPTSQSNKASAAATPSTLAILALAVCLYAVYL